MAQVNRCNLVRILVWIGLLIITVTSLQAANDFTRKGADDCLKCHDEESEFPVLSIFKTKHATKADPKSPFASAQCETCHGSGKAHGRSQKKGKDDNPMLTFGKAAKTTAIEQNEICLDCHKTHARLAWVGSVHEQEDVACASCHQIHVPRDRVFSAELQQQTCFSCHSRTKAELHRASTHPLRFGKMTCTDCHNPHDGNNDSLLTRSTINDTCYDCHAEKRGPFLWEHAPVSEDCTLCHNPHGSNHQAMLKQRVPLLCQQCHAPSGHPSTAYTSENANNGFQSRFILGRSCINCHSQVHGSNHPSGATIMR